MKTVRELSGAGPCITLGVVLRETAPKPSRLGVSRLETARIALGVTNSGDLANKIIAKWIIELGKAGERNPIPIFCVKPALTQLREYHLYGD